MIFDVGATERYIRNAAQARGIDPETAVRVARSEGLAANTWQSNNRKDGYREPSYGPFQLLLGGDGTGFGKGLGNEFVRRTGLDPSDPRNVNATIDFALDHAKSNGWGSWYGAAKVGVGKRDGIGSGSSGGQSMNYLRYTNQGATRSQPLSDQLTSALGFLPELGLTAEVYSGGQAAKGSGGPRTGSTRHDHGNAADVRFYQGDRLLNFENKADRPIFEEVVRRGKAAGLTGFGAATDYMGPTSMHIGFGSPGVWGAGGKGANAPDWLRNAFYSGAGSETLPDAMMNGASMASMAPRQYDPLTIALAERQQIQAPQGGGYNGVMIEIGPRKDSDLADAMIANANRLGGNADSLPELLGGLAQAFVGNRKRQEIDAQNETVSGQENAARREAMEYARYQDNQDEEWRRAQFEANQENARVQDANAQARFNYDAQNDARNLNISEQRRFEDRQNGLADAMVQRQGALEDYRTKQEIDQQFAPAPKQRVIQGPDGNAYYEDGSRVLPNVDAAQKPGFRPATPEEARQYGAPAGQIGPDNRFYPVQQPKGQTINVNTGGSPGLGKLSTDYGYVMDPSTGQPVIDPATGLPKAAPVPGSPAARDIDALGTKKQSAAGTRARDAGVVLQDIGRMRTILDNDGVFNPAVGFGAGLAGQVAGSNSSNIKALIDTVGANIGFDRLQQMREDSPTGGALGAVTERELALLQSVLGSLTQSQSEDQFRFNLDRLGTLYQGIQQKAAAYPNASKFGFEPASAQPSAQGDGAETAPQGVDPEDWAVMTPEERALFR